MVYPAARERVLSFHRSEFLKSLESQQRLPATRLLSGEEVKLLETPDDQPLDGNVVFEHERIAFPSFAHEWSPALLFAAGCFTLEVQSQAFDAGYSLKDATPSNVLFRGAFPVFVDYLSFERRQPGQQLWPAYAQFVRNFALPLLEYRLSGVAPHEHFFAHRDGVEPEAVYPRLSLYQRFDRLAFRFVTLPTLLAKSANTKTSRPLAASSTQNPEKSDYIARTLLTSLTKAFKQLAPRKADSRWSDYMSCHNYDQEAFRAKEDFVKAALTEMAPKTVLDVGCNTGHFSELAASLGASVVALDCDTVALDRVWELTAASSGRILPLVVNLARPTPALGWRNSEQCSFLERARNQFDVTLMLAVIHHLTATDGIPLREIFRLLSETTKIGTVVEYISPNDSMMQGLLRNKEHLTPSLDQETFEAALAPWFDVVRHSTRSDGRRALYFLRRKANRD